jgi:NAD(P)-dependent dehydrogenase (short-subunit alcohol dehydrogenase family)
MFDLTGKVALVTGSSQGLGGAIARCMADAGAHVVVNYVSDRSKEKAEKIAEYVRSKGHEALIIQADVSKEESVKAMMNQIVAHFGRLDILVNNAGINSNHNIDTMEFDEWHRILNTNIDSAFLCSKYAVPIMREQQHGRIILISSVVGQQGALFGQVHYASSKAAQQGFARTLARSVAQDGITVNCVAPGVIETEMNGLLDQETKDALAEETPLERMGTPADVAEAIWFLASQGGSFFTGQVLAPNGGFII